MRVQMAKKQAQGNSMSPLSWPARRSTTAAAAPARARPASRPWKPGFHARVAGGAPALRAAWAVNERPGRRAGDIGPVQFEQAKQPCAERASDAPASEPGPVRVPPRGFGSGDGGVCEKTRRQAQGPAEAGRGNLVSTADPPAGRASGARPGRRASVADAGRAISPAPLVSREQAAFTPPGPVWRSCEDFCDSLAPPAPGLGKLCSAWPAGVSRRANRQPCRSDSRIWRQHHGPLQPMQPR